MIKWKLGHWMAFFTSLWLVCSLSAGWVYFCTSKYVCDSEKQEVNTLKSEQNKWKDSIELEGWQRITATSTEAMGLFQIMW